FQKELDRIVGVARLVSLVRRGLVWNVGPDVLETAFGFAAAAYVAISKDVTLAREGLRRAERGAIVVDAVGRYCIWGALHPDRVRLRMVFGRVNRDEEMDAVAHGRHVFVFCIVRLDVVAEFLGLAALLVSRLAVLGAERSGGQRDREYCHSAKHPAHFGYLLAAQDFCFLTSESRHVSPASLASQRGVTDLSVAHQMSGSIST